MNLDDLTRCPTAAACYICERPDDLAKVTYESPVGIFCMTICGDCEDERRTPRLSAAAAVKRVLAHCEHLGITADDMEVELSRRA